MMHSGEIEAAEMKETRHIDFSIIISDWGEKQRRYHFQLDYDRARLQQL